MMGAAFDSACQSFHPELKDHEGARRKLALLILRHMDRGERDATRLSDLKQGRPQAGEIGTPCQFSWFLSSGTETAMLLGCQKEVKGEARYAYAPERHPAVFLFGRLRRWTRDRGRDLAHLSRATAAT